MRLTTRVRYGVRLMADLSQHYGQGPIFLRDISKRQGVSGKYLGNIVSVLKASGLVNARRGVYGGYSLAKKPDHISLKDIVCVLEKRAHLTGCIHNRRSCQRSTLCQVRGIWKRVEKAFYSSLDAITLRDVNKKCE